ncbi:hypothetical protein BN3087_150060 [Sulfurovum sp. enrichment culture clone C5]|uniref:Uncharacterized protein n=1 Tax=Sulfurovum sp. enrichment culture clone C5 TaxID=497650 RepID=A0A0S4XL45_9BACT|nr:hypothetical protein BN3087_150060 [Sulfurovum sp. enrichment culture clone C5]
MANVPHQFEKLTSREENVVVMIGAGMSYGLVPMANELKQSLELVTNNLSIEDDELLTENDPYKYADIVLKHIPNQDKLVLVQNMGIINNPKWFAKVGLPLRGTAPRHRVVARFARENLLHEIWNYNWDTILESAFESVGFTRGRKDGIKQPWNTLFDTIITYDDLTATPTDGFFKIYKPHGCLQAMKEAQELQMSNPVKSKKIAERFMIGQNELSLDKQWTDQEPGGTFLSLMHTSLNHHVMVIGWSLPEKYVHDKLKYIMESMTAEIEHLSIIDPFYQAGHTTIANRYNLNQNEIHFEVSSTQTGLTTDNLFLALQTKYSLKQLLKNTDEQSDEWNTIQGVLTQCDLGNTKDTLLSWADNFLPAWIRLCWRTEHLKVRTFNPFDIRLEKQDVHIPYQGIETTRIDMEMAATIFHYIQNSKINWDFSTFAGGLWDYENTRLVIPLPNATFSTLHVIKPLVRMIEEKVAYITSIAIMPITHNSLHNSSANILKNSIMQIVSKPQLMRDNFWKSTNNLIDYEDII